MQAFALRATGTFASSAAGTWVLIHQQPLLDLTSQRLLCLHKGQMLSFTGFTIG